jgi:hypothetical protein
MPPELAARIGRLDPLSHGPTARDVRRAWLAARADAATDTLAELALDAIEQRDAVRAALHAAGAYLEAQYSEIGRRRAVAR